MNHLSILSAAKALLLSTLVLFLFTRSVTVPDDKHGYHPEGSLPQGQALLDQLEVNRLLADKDPRGLFYFDTIEEQKGQTRVKAMFAEEKGEDIAISFITAEEYEVEHFELEVSVDHDKYKSLEKIEPQNDSKETKDRHYLYLDKNSKKEKSDARRVSYILYEINKKGGRVPVATTSQSLQSTSGPAGIESLLPQVTPLSPNVAAIERYGNSPVSYFTGQPDIEIKIWDIQVGDMVIPLRLKFHPGGHRVLDKAPWTGLGWTLTGLYALTRDPRGMGDENGGLWNQNLPNYPSPTISCLTEALKSDLIQHIFYQKDLERDVFTYRTPIRSNSFIFKPGSHIFLEADRSRVDYSTTPNLLSTITVTDPLGNRFVYADKENTFANNVSNTTAWHLSSIETSQPGEKVRYTYQDAQSFTVLNDITSYETWYTNVCVNQGSAPVMGGSVSNYHTNTAIIEARNPKEIFFPGGKIEFIEESTNRTDGYGKALNLIKIYGYSFMSNNYVLIRQFDLDYVYKSRVANAGQVLFLDRVKMLDASGTEVGRHSLTYNNQALPDMTSFAKDLQGFYNGATTNTTLIPAGSFSAPLNCGTDDTHNIGGGNRTPNETLMQAWQLTRLTHPTGGHTDYTYEAHKYLNTSMNPVLVGGLRIKSMISDDGNGNTETLRIKYGTGESGYGTHRDQSKAIMRTDQKIKRIPTLLDPDQSNYTYYIRHFSSGVNGIINPFESVPVTYPLVTVYQDLNGTGANGKTVYQFKDNAYDDLLTHPATYRQVLQSEHWNRGQLMSKTVYGADGDMKQREVNGYDELVPASATEDLGYIIGRQEIRIGSEVLAGGCLDNDDIYNPVIKYRWVSGLTVPVQTETYLYDDTDPDRYVYALTEYDYDATYFQKETERFYRSDGSVAVKKYRYCTDIPGISTSSTGQAAAIYQLILNNELHRPVEITNYYKATVAGAERAISGSLSLGIRDTFNSYIYVLPDEIYLLEINRDVLFAPVAFDPLVGSGNSLAKDSKYDLRLSFDSYNSYGKLTQYHLPGGSPTTYTHSSITKDGVYQSKVNTKKENDSGNSNYISHTTTFTNDVPLLGPTVITAPNGLKIYFEYDNFGRLLRIKNHDQKILEEYEYNLMTGTRFVKTKTPRVALTSTSGASHTQMETIIAYVDGLGRPLQKVHVKGQPNGSSDIVTGAVTYDGYGRVANALIPFGSSGGGLATLPGTVHGDNKPFSMVKTWDDSPLNRPKESLGPGTAWHTQNKWVTQQYEVAPAGIRKYVLATSASVGTPVSYGADDLANQVTISEEGNSITVYTDNQGKTVQSTQPQSTGITASTYTIYDQHDQVRYIIQPEKGLTSQSFNESSTYFTQGVFANKYDKRGRVRQYHTPGGGWNASVYDRLDREVLSQNALQATQNLWTYKKYEAMGRVIETGELVSDRTRIQLQDDFAAITNAYEQWDNSEKTYTDQSYPSTLSGASKEVRSRLYYDVYDIGAATVSGILFDGSQTTETQYTNATGWLTWSFCDESENHSLDFFRKYFYNNRSWQIQTIEGHHMGASNKPLKISNNYNFIGEVIKTSQHYQFDDLDAVTLVEEFIPDHKGRIKSYKAAINATTTSEICTTQYDVTGRLLQKIYYPGQQFTAGSGLDFIVRPPNPEDPNTQDVARKAVILNAGAEINTAIAPYSAEIDPNLGNPVSINGLQTIDYSFNIRDWLTGINLNPQGNAIPNTDQGDVFALKLQYESNERYDGQLSVQSWQLAADVQEPAVARSYFYFYDMATRLSSAIYTGGTNNYSVNGITFDRNGNLITLSRYMTTTDKMDELTYTTVGNRLMKVEDAIPGDHEIDFVNLNSGSDDYEYYPDGCLKKDLNENISLIEYDTYLGKPIKVTLGSGEWIRYIYSGEGSLIRRECIKRSKLCQVFRSKLCQ